MTKVIEFVQPREYFKDCVTSAADSLKVGLEADQEYYLVNLLCEFISLPSSDQGGSHPLSTPLAIMLQQAMESGPDERFRILKRLGDTSLYLAGFFQDYFNRKAFDITYYIAMGSSAYQGVSSLVRERPGQDQFSGMYRQLAKDFGTLVEVIAEISDNQPQKPDIDLLATYDRWARTNSERLRRILLKQGIIPQPSNVQRAI